MKTDPKWYGLTPNKGIKEELAKIAQEENSARIDRLVDQIKNAVSFLENDGPLGTPGVSYSIKKGTNVIRVLQA